MDELKFKSLYIDVAFGNKIEVDDFIVAIGKKKSNSVYHVAEIVRRTYQFERRMDRHHIKVLNTDLLTALKRDPEQQLFPMTWYKRKKKKA